MTVATNSMADSIKTFTSRLSTRESTKREYTLILKRFARSCPDPSDVDAGIQFCNAANCVRTRNLYLVAINQYRRSLSLPALPIKTIRPQKKQFNTTRIRETFDAILPLCRVERDRALLALLRYGGLRISEAINIRTRDVTFPDGQLQVAISVSKTTPRDPLVWRATRYLRDYLDRTRLSPAGWLFPSRSGRHLSARMAEDILGGLSDSVEYHISPHDLRRLCATEMAKKFGLQILMDYFGWDSVVTAQVYIDKARGSSSDAIRSELGIGNKSDLFTTQNCWRCGTANPPAQQHCGCCGELLDLDGVPHADAIKNMEESELESLLVRILTKRGILPSRS